MSIISSLSLYDRKIVVGIDFGTTFSGVAWAETRRPDQQFIIEEWPASLTTREGYSSPKVPTELRYGPEGLQWGAQIPPLVDREAWFKLHFEDARNKRSLIPLSAPGATTSSSAGGSMRSPDELARDYLKELYKHLMYTLEQKLGSGILRDTPIDFVLTVPAIWSEKAKERTLNACKAAGVKSASPIELVSEPEAAATYSLHGLDPHNLKVGDTFVICDAGGGTVDLISYTITELKPVLKVIEAAPGDGDRCGSTFLNKNFERYLIETLGREPGWDNDTLIEAMHKFETVIKKQYSPTNATGEAYTIMVPDMRNNDRLGIRRGRFTMKVADLHQIFEPVISRIIDLVKDQIRTARKKIRAVLLVGGFGQNNYLRQRIRGSLDRSVEVMQPPNAWTAVERGAVMMGLARCDSNMARVGVMSRAARKHYGVDLHIPFDAAKHDISKRYWDSKRNQYRVYAMHWFIEKGDPVTENTPQPIEFFTDFLVSNGQPTSTSLTVWCDEFSPTAPVHRSANARKLVKLEADLRQLPKSSYASSEKMGSDGQGYYEIWGYIKAIYYSASTKYILEVAGKHYDTVTAEHV